MSDRTLDATTLLVALRAARKGDFGTRLPSGLTGISGEIASAFNEVLELNEAMAGELSRMSRTVGREGRIDERASLGPVTGGWATCVTAVNGLIQGLVQPGVDVARVIGAVAEGDLSQRMAVETGSGPLEGQFASTARTVNRMVEQLGVFAAEVTRVAREVGTEGHLGGQAEVPGAAGIWRDLTDNVNRLAANLTTQVRSIAEVATAVATGDLSRSITVQAEGEVAALKDHINEMILNLKDTTRKNTENDWLKTHLARFTLMLQGQRNLTAFSTLILSELASVVGALHGVFYVLVPDRRGASELRVLSTYACRRRGVPVRFALGEGLPGQCALEKSRILLTDVPVDYIRITSGLGHARPANVILLPVVFEGEVKAVIELASLSPLSDLHLTLLEQLTEGIGIVLNTLSTILRTEALLLQSQTLTQELQTRQEELKRTNERLEQQNLEVVVARNALEEKAAQLALTSKYKSWFLANVSHELRTPLGGIIGFAELLHEGLSGPLTDLQREHTHHVLRSAEHLAALVDDLLDSSKLEAGRMQITPRWTPVESLTSSVVGALRPVAAEAGLELCVDLPAGFPDLFVDPLRMRQILFNLVSNGIKFSSAGSTVTLRGRLDVDGASIAVEDHGLGIPPDHVGRLFGEFEQLHPPDAEHRPLGTGLGLSVTRRLVELHEGTIDVDTEPGRGSVFTVRLPARHVRPSGPAA